MNVSRMFYICQLIKFQKWIKFLVKQEMLNSVEVTKIIFIRQKICPISFLFYNERIYNTFLRRLRATNIRITFFLFQNPWNSLAFFNRDLNRGCLVYKFLCVFQEVNFWSIYGGNFVYVKLFHVRKIFRTQDFAVFAVFSFCV